MSALISAQPKIFDSREAAIGWQYVSASRGRERPVRAPPRTDCLADSLDSRTINNVESARISVPSLVKPIAGATPEIADGGEGKYEWTVDLSKTEPYWKGAWEPCYCVSDARVAERDH